MTTTFIAIKSPAPPGTEVDYSDDAFSMIGADEAYKHSIRSNFSKWPQRSTINRIEPLCMPGIEPGFELKSGCSVFTIGSCFARHIEKALEKHGFKAPALNFRPPSNELWKGTTMPSGILNKYTPFSMTNEIEFAIGSESGEKYLIETGLDQYWDGQLHTTESVGLERAIERRGELRELYRNSMLNCPVVIITLGLVESWWDSQNQVYLNETVPKSLVKKYPGRFHFEVLSPEKIISATTKLINMLHSANPSQNVLLTVSPVPLQRTFTSQDVITANSYSKSVLRVAAETVSRRYKHVDYYPSYESVSMSDRKLTWDDDLIHVNSNVVAMNVDRMIKVYGGL